MAFITSFGELKPLYTIRQFNDCVYKIVRFKRSDGFSVYVSALRDTDTTSGLKSDASLSRARRMVFEKALCNKWDYFFTGTLDGSKHDRYDLTAFASQLNEFFKYRRRVYGTDLRFLLVPEKHHDGAWHVHGLLGGIPDSKLCGFTPEFFKKYGLKVNKKLCLSDYQCWVDFFEKFGFCSLAPVRSTVGVSYYITKYISKELGERREELGRKLYYSSHGLKTAEKLCDLYMPFPELDKLCTQEYEFCATGLVTDASWVFGNEWWAESDQYEELFPRSLEAPDDAEAASIDKFHVMSYENVKIEGM